MFLFKAAFWLTIVLLLLPADPQNGQPAPRVGLFEALAAAQSAVQDISQICQRQPEACQTGNNALHLLGDKLRYGTELVYKYLDRPAADTEAKPTDASSSGLTPDEIRIPWHKPTGDKSV